MSSISNDGAIAALDAIAATCDLGTTNPSATLVFYDGAVPARADAALSGNTVLAQLVMTNPAWGAAVDVPASNLARAVANAISDDTDADADGECMFCRVLDRDGTPRLQFTVSETGGGGEITVNSATFSEGARVTVTSPLNLQVLEG